ncbi:sigma-70 family RNA polymerase sigma factor [Thermocaproicibacter melissae]|uniref:sigma-70 family RNA polymerase sigma factor n=1 Tax=Thermocaproicibacter melissae TaxID=2966552 RepID=UPI0024B26775|nr:FliA/WhiG family RNA polymerase sigma factor [Thermocaproicibacter melissae]WBY64332.1 FliA/WhiG family RNA polymerase sigma factor [Thermocaproicibacter melissae]
MTQTAETILLPIQELWLRYKKDRLPELRDELIRHYSYLVRCIARKIVGHYEYFSELDDLVSEGLIALMDAVQKFELDKNVKFETYASIRIRGAMIDYIRRQDCFPRRLKRLSKQLTEASETLCCTLGREPTDAELAKYLNVSPEDYEKMLAETCSMNMLSFEELIYEKGCESLSLHTGSDSQGPEQAMAEKELKEILAESISRLDEKEKIVISLYYKEELKIREISQILGISDSRVSQIHSSALKKLKNSVGNYLKQ